MKNILRLLGLSLCVVAAQSFAEMVEAPTDDGGGNGVGFEFDVQGAYVGGGDIERGTIHYDDVDELNFLARFLILPRTPVGILRVGAEYELYDFDLSDSARIPDTLQSAALVIGLDTKFSDSLLIRFEATPGFYSGDDLSGDDFNAPFILGGTYLYSSTLQFVFGIGVNYEREFPVLPGGGFRWKFAPQWVLNATAPTPRLEFEVNRNLMLYAGADLRSKVFRVDSEFGTSRGIASDLNGAVHTYTEVRTGGGLIWKVGDVCRITAEGGFVPYRKFDFHRADIGYESDGGALYGAVALHLGF